MAIAQESDYCNRHTDQAAIGRCDQCGRSFCKDCRIEDVAADEEFCSAECREQRIATRPGERVATQDELLDGSDQPIRTGWKLWARSLPQLFLHTAPLAAVMGYVSWLVGAEPMDVESGDIEISDGLTLFLLVGLSFGIALVQVVLSQRHTGLVKGNPYMWTLQRFVPWVLAVVNVFVITMLGMIALILPGMYLGLRLFWADEFALVHKAGPLQALKDSWRLTEGEAGPIFKFQFIAGWAAYLVLIVGGLLFGFFQSALELVDVPSLSGPVEQSLAYALIFVGYGAVHAPEIVHFYGMRAEASRGFTASAGPLGLS